MNFKCKDCFYWSSLIAQAEEFNKRLVMTAMCFNKKSHSYQKYTSEGNTCEYFESDCDGLKIDDSVSKGVIRGKYK